jgi:inhibitor of cysteine peptidase
MMRFRSNRVLWVALILGTVTLFLAACNRQPPDTQVGPEMSGQAVQMQVGQDLLVSLPSNPSTGYAWQVETIDPTVLQQVGGGEYQSLTSTPRPGAGGIESFRFKAVGPGQAPLRLVYRRSFEEGEPAEIFFVQVVVR